MGTMTNHWRQLAAGCAAALLASLLITMTTVAAHAAVVPPKGAASTLDIASWNIEWFGDTGNGPSNEPLQLQNARDVILGADMDIWGLAEIVSTSQFNSLKSQLPGYAGFLANDASVVNGAAYYAATEQKPGLLYKSSLATVLDARIILTANDGDFAGRPPMQVKLRVSLNGRTEDIVLIVLHAKCCTDTTSWTRRANAASALKTYLDATFPTQKVWVVGDFNDDVDVSISPGKATPYAGFVNDTARYRFATKVLSDAGVSSTVSFADMIDHHLVTNEAYAALLPGSVEAYRVDQYLGGNYGSSTSDHYPVLSRYNWDGGGTTPPAGEPAQVILNEIGANEAGSNTDGEFVELLNVGGTAVDIGGWTVSDASGVRHGFQAGTVLQPGKAIVVFGGAASIPSGLTNAVAASTGTLALSNSGDTVTLRNTSGAVVQSMSYSSTLAGSDGVSINRSPDGNASGTWVKHNTLASTPSSAGLKASGAAW